MRDGVFDMSLEHETTCFDGLVHQLGWNKGGGGSGQLEGICLTKVMGQKPDCIIILAQREYHAKKQHFVRQLLVSILPLSSAEDSLQFHTEESRLDIAIMFSGINYRLGQKLML